MVVHSRVLGILLITASAVVFSLSGTLTKAIESGVWTILCWRGLLGAILVSGYVVLRRDSVGGKASFRLGWRGWLLATVGSLSSIAFIAAFKLTYVANVAIIYATVPFVAAVLERLLLGERFRHSTLLAALISVAGVLVMFQGGLGTGNLIGDAVAILMTVGNALYMVLIRAFKDTPVVWAGAVSALQLFVVAWFVVDPLSVSFEDGLLLLLFGVSFAMAVVLWTEGTRLVAAAESGLIGSSEVPFAILFAWLIIAEVPPVTSLVGGGIVLVAVFGHAVSDYVQVKAAKSDCPDRVA